MFVDLVNKVGTPNCHFVLLCLDVSIIRLIRFSLIFLLGSESKFQCTKKHDIWILYAKVIEDQSFLGRSFKIVSSS